MTSWWSPKPLRPAAANPLFKMEEGPVVEKSLSPMQRQRQADGSPYTRTSPTGLRPADPELILRPELLKGSLMEKQANRPELPKQDPEDPLTIVKSYMAWDPDAGEKAESVKKSQSAVDRMRSAISKVLHKTGVSAKK